MDKEAPELQELQNPVNFSDFHRYMTMSTAQLDEEYENQIQQHGHDILLYLVFIFLIYN